MNNYFTIKMAEASKKRAQIQKVIEQQDRELEALTSSLVDFLEGRKLSTEANIQEKDFVNKLNIAQLSKSLAETQLDLLEAQEEIACLNNSNPNLMID